MAGHGENTVLECMEFKKSYSGLEFNLKVFTNKTENLAMFPSTPEELKQELYGIVDKKVSEIEKKEDEIKKLKAEIVDIKRIESGELMNSLKTMSFKEYSQVEYNQKKIELEASKTNL